MTDANLSEHPIFTDPIGYQLGKVEAMAQPSVHYGDESRTPGDHPTPMLRLLRQRVYDSRSIWDDEPPPDEQLESGLSVAEAIGLEAEVDKIVAENARLRYRLRWIADADPMKADVGAIQDVARLALSE